MPEFNKFSQITFVDTTSPAINAANLNELERVVKLADSELSLSYSKKFQEWLEYFYERNVKLLTLFENYATWNNAYPANASLSDEKTLNLMGNVALKITAITASAGWMSVYQVPTVVDLSVFNDGGSSSTSDLVLITFYVSNASAFQDLEIKLGDDTSNCYFYDMIGTFQTGWNCKYIQKSAFTVNGTPTGWNNIVYIRVAPYLLAGYSGAYIILQQISICRQDSVYAGYSNPFQIYKGSITGWENWLTFAYDVQLLYRDEQNFIKKIGTILIPPIASATARQMILASDVIQFKSKFELYCKYAGNTGSFAWWVDTSNFAKFYITSNVLYLTVYEAGTPTTVSVALTNNLLKNECIYIYFEKEDNTFIVILEKKGESLKSLTYETTISSTADGNVVTMQESTTSFSMLTDFVISNRPITKLAGQLLPTISYMQEDQLLVNNTLTNLLGLYVNLEPNKCYEIEICVSAGTAVTGVDVQIAWELTNAIGYTYRNVQGPIIGDPSNCTVRHTMYNVTTSVTYATSAAGSLTYINEKAIVFTQRNAGKVQIKGSQVNTDAAHPTTINFFSYIKATPIKFNAHTNI